MIVGSRLAKALIDDEERMCSTSSLAVTYSENSSPVRKAFSGNVLEQDVTISGVKFTVGIEVLRTVSGHADAYAEVISPIRQINRQLVRHRATDLVRGLNVWDENSHRPYPAKTGKNSKITPPTSPLSNVFLNALAPTAPHILAA